MATDTSFDSTLISASRVDQFLSCGAAFKFRYLDNRPAEVSGSSSLYGTALHRALETWAPDRSQQLSKHLAAGWLHATQGTPVAEFLTELAPLSERADELCDDILKRRPDIRVPRMTKDYKSSAVAKEIEQLVKKWLPALDESPWRFTERDPLPSLYAESFRSLARYEKKWMHLPPPYQTEFEFRVNWRGFVLRGHIDTLEPIIDHETGLIEYFGIVDYKTYKQEPAEFKDWRQLVIYNVAFEEMVELGIFPEPGAPVLCGIDYVSLRERRFWQVTEEDEERLYAELCAYKQRVDAGQFLPACKSTNTDFCDYPSVCCLKTLEGVGGGMTRVEVNV